MQKKQFTIQCVTEMHNIIFPTLNVLIIVLQWTKVVQRCSFFSCNTVLEYVEDTKWLKMLTNTEIISVISQPQKNKKAR